MDNTTKNNKAISVYGVYKDKNRLQADPLITLNAMLDAWVKKHPKAGFENFKIALENAGLAYLTDKLTNPHSHTADLEAELRTGSMSDALLESRETVTILTK